MIRRGLAALGIVALAACVDSEPAWSHPSLQSTSPSDGEVVERGIDSVDLVFDEPVDAGLGGVDVRGADGGRADRGEVETVDGGRVLRTPVEARARGTYTVTWRVLSEDAHTLSGTFVFHVGEASTDVAPVAEARDGDGAVAAWGAIGRWLSFAGLMAAVGSLVVSSATRGLGRAARRLRRVMVVAATLGALGSLAALVATIADASGRSLIGGAALVPDVVRGSRLGHVGFARVASAAALAVAGGVVPWWRGAAWARSVVAVPALILILSTALGGHAWTTAPRFGAVLVDVVHLTAVSVWIGCLAAVLLTAPVAEDAHALVRSFSRVAGWAVVVVTVSGVMSAWAQVRSFDALTSTPYGWLLILKVAVVIVMVAVGWLNRRALGRAEERVALVLRRGRLEVAAATAVLALTAVLVDVQPARDAVERPFAASLPSADGQVELEVQPARVGRNDVSVDFLTSAGRGRPLDSAELLVSVGDVAERKVELRAGEGGASWSADVVLEAPGLWRITVGGARGGVSETVTFEVPVR